MKENSAAPPQMLSYAFVEGPAGRNITGRLLTLK